jgi:hypothetical protein
VTNDAFDKETEQKVISAEEGEGLQKMVIRCQQIRRLQKRLSIKA